MEKPATTKPKSNKININNVNNIEDDEKSQSNEETNGSEIVDPDLSPEAEAANIKKDLPLLKELIILVYFGPLLPAELAELYSQYTGMNLRKKTKVPVKEFLKGHRSIFKFIITHKLVEGNEKKKKEKLELVALKLEHDLVKEVLKDPTPSNQMSKLDYEIISNKVNIR